MKIKARLIITFECKKKCVGCCNSYNQIMRHSTKISKIDSLVRYDTILITGGEPLLRPDRTLSIILRIKKINPKAKFYLYTAFWSGESELLNKIIDSVNGVQYSLHEGATKKDIKLFYEFQKMALRIGSSRTFRLYIDPKVKHSITIQPSIWLRVEVKPWMTEEELLALQPKGLPLEEELLVYVGE